jgi:hypothetical protein
MEGGYYNKYQWNPKDHKRILWKPIFEQTRKPRRNEYISRCTLPTKIKPRGYQPIK